MLDTRIPARRGHTAAHHQRVASAARRRVGQADGVAGRRHGAPTPPRGMDRLERAATLLLATSALAGAALVGWGGFVLDLRPLDSIAAGLIRAVAGGSAPWPGTAETRVGLRWQDIAPLA